MTTNLLFTFCYLHIFCVFTAFEFPAKSRPAEAAHPTTTHLLPTYTRLIMSDSSVLNCCANFISKLHSLEESSPWQGGWAAWSSTPTWWHCQRRAMSCAQIRWRPFQAKICHLSPIKGKNTNTSASMRCFTVFGTLCIVSKINADECLPGNI